jgi:tetratricopeptide (TPR) repeat protein
MRRLALGTCLFGLAACPPKAETTPPAGPAETPAPTAAVDPFAAAPPQATPAEAPPPAKRNRDRDPAEERRKMAASRQQSQQARNALRAGDLAGALEKSREALRTHEQNVDAMLVMAEVFLKQGKHELAQTVTGSALAVDPKLLTPEETSRAHNLKGFAFLAAGKPNLATQAFRKAAEADAKNATAWNNLGAQYLRTQNYKTAAECFTYATRLDSSFYKAHLNLGNARRAMGDLLGAEGSYRTALQLRPDYPEAFFSLGVLYLDASEYPGIDTTTRLNRALNFFQKYRERAIAGGAGAGDRPGDDVARVKSGSGPKPRTPPPSPGKENVSVAQADLYIELAKKGLEREKKREERNQKKGQDAGAAAAADAGKPSAAAKPGASAPGPAATPGETAPPGDAASPPATAGETSPAPAKPGGTPPATSPAKPGGTPPPTSPAKPGGTPPTSPAPAKPGGTSAAKPGGTPPPSPGGTPTSPAKPGGTPPTPSPANPGETPSTSPAPAKPGGTPPPATTSPAPAKPGGTPPPATTSPAPAKPGTSSPAPVAKPGGTPPPPVARPGGTPPPPVAKPGGTSPAPASPATPPGAQKPGAK